LNIQFIEYRHHILLISAEKIMTQVIAGRFKAQTDQPVVVFLIGMRINNYWAVSKWLPTFMAMSPMLSNLHKHPEKGFLGAEQFLYPHGVGLLQYWRSPADLLQFARQPSDPHVKAWQRFNKAIGSDGSVGIWHETYQVNPAQTESIYVNMPIFGLAAATNYVSLGSGHE
jgi:Domain of unknown function (DUF4188)